MLVSVFVDAGFVQGIENVEYLCGKAEVVLPRVLDYTKGNCIGILYVLHHSFFIPLSIIFVTLRFLFFFFMFMLFFLYSFFFFLMIIEIHRVLGFVS